jgi:hypothetical protein
MFSTTNENNEFSAIGQEELEKVNGGEPITTLTLGLAVAVLCMVNAARK